MSLISFKIIFQCVSWRDKLEKERTRFGPKSDFFFGVRNWMCENMQKRVSHSETVRVGSSVIVFWSNLKGGGKNGSTAPSKEKSSCHHNRMEMKTTSKIDFSSHGVTVAWHQSLITCHQNMRFCISDIHGPIESKLDM